MPSPVRDSLMKMGDGRRLSLIERLPQELLVRIAQFLPGSTHFRNFQLASPELSRNLKVVWTHRLKKDFGLSIKVTEASDETLCENMYRAIKDAPVSAIRFMGAFTDGGCDEDLDQYWVDNMFHPYGWDSYCSGGEKNIHCIGLYMADDIEGDKQHQEYREYLIQRLKGCRHGVNGITPRNRDHVSDPAARLRLAPTAILEENAKHAFEVEQQHMLHYPDTAGRPYGVFAGVPKEKFYEERARLAKIYEERLKDGAPKSRMLLRASVVPHPDKAEAQGDPQTLAALRLPEADRRAGVVDGVYVSRAGFYSCPLSTGVVFLGNADVAGLGKLNSTDVVASMAAVSASSPVSAFDDIRTWKGVIKASKRGRLPPIIGTGVQSSGIWVEFGDWPEGHEEARLCSTAARPLYGRLRPLVWFKFFPEKAVALVRAYHHGILRGPRDKPSSKPVLPPGAQHTALRYIRKRFAADAECGHVRDCSQGQTPFVGSKRQLEGLDQERRRKGLRLRRHLGHYEVMAPLEALAPPGGAAGLPLAEGLNGVMPVFANAVAHAQWVAMNNGNPLPVHPPQPGFWGYIGPDAGDSDSDASDFEDDDEDEEMLGPLLVDAGGLFGAVGAAQGGAVLAGEVGALLAGGHHDGEEDFDDDDDSDEEVEPAVAEAPPSQHEMVAMANQIADMLRDRSDLHKRSINNMDIPLRRKRAGNMVLVKLINQENLMVEHNDQHDIPNIDVSQVVCYGRRVVLPAKLSLAI